MGVDAGAGVVVKLQRLEVEMKEGDAEEVNTEGKTRRSVKVFVGSMCTCAEFNLLFAIRQSLACVGVRTSHSQEQRSGSRWK